MPQRNTGQKTEGIEAATPLEDSWANMPASFQRALKAQNKAKGTVASYMESLRYFYAYLARKGMPLGLESIRREHVESWLVELQNIFNARTGQPISAATLGKHYKALNIYFGWALDEGEIREHPMAKMKRPIMPESPPPLLEKDEIDRLLKECSGKDFYARRDTAIIRLLLDTGIRVSELVGLKLTDIDWQHDTVTVMGKGRRQRTVPFGRKTAQALDRYIRARSTYPTAKLPDLWLGHSGKALTRSGVLQIVHNRGEAAGIEKLHPHMFRHQFSHEWLSSGGTEGGLLRLAGWRSRTMLQKYAASAADDRAREEHKKLSPGDRF